MRKLNNQITFSFIQLVNFFDDVLDEAVGAY